MVNVKDIEIKNIDHLGIVAGIIDSIGLVEIINDLIGVEEGEKVSAGHVVKALILNGLGMVSQPLYMFPKFFENIACDEVLPKRKGKASSLVVGIRQPVVGLLSLPLSPHTKCVSI